MTSKSAYRRRQSTALLRQVVDQARRAPSIHNSQPWRWRIEGNRLELWADRSRQLRATDATGRNLTISCGAALHHAVVAGQALGQGAYVEHLPDAARADLMARVTFEPAPFRPGDDLFLEAIQERCTDRRRFTSWPVPDDRLIDLAHAAGSWGANALPLTDAALRFRVEVLVEDALREQARNAAVVAEEQAWVERGPHEGIPRTAVPPLFGARGERRSRFVSQVGEVPSRRLGESTDGLIAICTAADDQVAWLHAGEALSAIWLRATLTGLSLVPLSQVVEVPGTRRELDDLVLRGNGHTQILARIGWQEIGRASLSRTARRSLDDVLVEEVADDDRPLAAAVPPAQGPRTIAAHDRGPSTADPDVEML